MQLSIDLTGREVLVTGSDHAARQAVRRYEAAGAVVYRLSTPQGAAHDGPLPERPFLVAAVDDGQSQAQIDELQATADGISGQRNSLFKGETLRGLLLSAYAWSTVGTIAGIAAIGAFVAAGLMAILVALGIVHQRRTTTTA